MKSFFTVDSKKLSCGIFLKAAGDPKLTEMAKLSEMQSQLRDKQRELLELQKHKLELELVATRQRIEEEEKKINLQTASVKMVSTWAMVEGFVQSFRFG